jgi:hypothetical protein
MDLIKTTLDGLIYHTQLPKTICEVICNFNLTPFLLLQFKNKNQPITNENINPIENPQPLEPPKDNRPYTMHAEQMFMACCIEDLIDYIASNYKYKKELVNHIGMFPDVKHALRSDESQHALRSDESRHVHLISPSQQMDLNETFDPNKCSNTDPNKCSNTDPNTDPNKQFKDIKAYIQKIYVLNQFHLGTQHKKNQIKTKGNFHKIIQLKNNECDFTFWFTLSFKKLDYYQCVNIYNGKNVDPHFAFRA